MAPAAPQMSKQFIQLLIVAMILTGAANTIVYKIQNKTSISVHNGEYTKFVHPFMQAVTMFMGESICILLFLIAKKKPEYKAEAIEAQARGLKTNVNYGWLAVPAMCDLMASTLSYVALNYISPSIYQMMRGGAIITTAIMSRLFLKRKIQNFQLFGCALVLLGITTVGGSSFLFPPSNADDVESTSTEQLIAIMLLIVSVFFNGLQFVSEEKLFDVYFLHPFQVVGAEGLWGLVAYIIITTSLTFTPCPEAMEANCIPYNGTYYFERADYYFMQAAQSFMLTFWIILGIFTIATFNICGVSVTKYVSSLARSIVDVSRTVVIWIVAIIITKTTNQVWENTRWQAILVELAGFIMLVSGNLIYNGTIKIAYFSGPKTHDQSQESLVGQSLQGE